MFLINSFVEVLHLFQKGILFSFNLFLYLFICILITSILIAIFFNLCLVFILDNHSSPTSEDLKKVENTGLILPLNFTVLKFESGRDCNWNAFLFFSEDDFLLKQFTFFSDSLQTMVKNRSQCIDKIFTINKTLSSYGKYRDFKISNPDFISYFDFRLISNDGIYGSLIKTQKGNYCEFTILTNYHLYSDSFYKE